MHQKKFRRFPLVVICILVLFLLVCLASIIINQTGANLEQLNDNDQAVLAEYNKLCTSLEEEDIWKDFHLEDKTILAMPGSWKGYLINPSEPVSSVFAKKISLPKDWNINVYRLAAVTPEMMRFRFDWNFNTIDKTYSLFGNDLYYIKYDGDNAVRKKWSSEHFSTFLSHESFHYYMQNDWVEGGRFFAEDLTSEDIDLLEKEYNVLSKIQDLLISDEIDHDALKLAAKEYISVKELRLAANPDYVQKEIEMETVEGSATYVGIKASAQVEYDYGVMYFDNQKNVSFSEVVPQYRAGNLEKNFFADRMPYETGALLCLLMDELDVPDWQGALNNQTKEAPQTLYSVLKTRLE